jgi:hypothetical protein
MATAKAGQMKCSAGDSKIRLRSDGRWEVRLALPSRKCKSLYGKTRQDAQQKHRAGAGARESDSALVFVSIVGTRPHLPRSSGRGGAGKVWVPCLAPHGREPAHCRSGPAQGHSGGGGRSLLSTTADIYGHLFPWAFVEAANAMARALA